MYSYEDRIRAVELYIKLGKRLRPTLRQLGCPTKNALKGWFRDYEQRLDVPVGYACRKPKYSQAQKEAALRHYLTHERRVAATIRALGYPGRGSLTNWLREAFLQRPAEPWLAASGGRGIPSPGRGWSRWRQPACGDIWRQRRPSLERQPDSGHGRRGRRRWRRSGTAPCHACRQRQAQSNRNHARVTL